MNLTDLARRIGARVVTEGHCPVHVIDSVYAGDRISDLLTHASRQTLLVTNLSSALLVCVAELMDVPAVCLVGGQAPAPEIVSAAKGRGMGRCHKGCRGRDNQRYRHGIRCGGLHVRRLRRRDKPSVLSACVSRRLPNEPGA
jgi:hypothetical protein